MAILRHKAWANDNEPEAITTPLTAPADVIVTTSPPSVWLYLAGLCVTLSGLYAVNYGSPDQSFTLLTVCLAVCGYLVSYIFRARGIAMQSLHTPFLVVLGLTLLAMLSSDRGLGWLAPMGVDEDRARILQFIFAWLAIIHSFLLSSDAAVLFACVPCMTMLALVSTRNTDPEIQNAFLTFIGASTFMMVHENYLRTRSAQVSGRFTSRDGRLFGGQLQLTAICLVGALILANFVAVPIRTVGQTLFESGALNQGTNKVVQLQRVVGAGGAAAEQSEIDLGSGPVADSDTEIMRVKSPKPLNWRGKTFSLYTGAKFVNSDVSDTSSVAHEIDAGSAARNRHTDEFVSSDATSFQAGQSTYEVPPSSVEMAGVDPHNRETIEQTVTILAGSSRQLYGASSIAKLTGALGQVSAFADGSVVTSLPEAEKSYYGVVSSVPKDEGSLLHAASSSPDDIPAVIRQTYEETRVWHRDMNDWTPESTVLRAIVNAKIKGLTNNYDKAQAIADYIRATCQYTLRPKPTPVGKDVVEYFLTEQKKGYCTSFAAAMTMLARYAGIPARLASGYLAGDSQNDGTFLVRDKHKHVWAELFFPKIGWVPFDATDGATDAPEQELQNGAKKITFMAWVFSHGWLPPITILSIVGLLGYVLKAEILDRLHWRSVSSIQLIDCPSTNREIVNAYLDSCDLLRRRGLPRLDYQTPNEYHRRIQECTEGEAAKIGDIMMEITCLFMQYRYGTGVASASDAQAAQAAAQELRRTLSELPRDVLGRCLAPADA